MLKLIIMKNLNLICLVIVFLSFVMVSCEKEDLASDIKIDAIEIKKPASTDSEEEVFQGIAIPILDTDATKHQGDFQIPNRRMFLENLEF